MKRAAAKPVAKDPKDTVAEVDGTTTMKRSGRFSKKRKSVDVTTAATGELQSEKKPIKRRCRTGCRTGIAAIEAVRPPQGASLLASAFKKKGKATGRGGSTGKSDGGGGSRARGRPKNCEKRPAVVASEARGARGGRAANEPENGSKGRVDVVESAAGDSGERSACAFDRDVLLLSRRFGLPRDGLRDAVERDAASGFRDRFPGSVTAAAIVVSPVVATSWPRGPWTETAGGPRGVRYAVEPARASAGCGAATLGRLMDELTGTAPSWALSAVARPHRYVISHMTVDAYGAPAVDKSVVLDRQFRASVYVDGHLRYEYGGRYGTATEIVNLISELNAIGGPTAQ